MLQPAPNLFRTALYGCESILRRVLQKDHQEALSRPPCERISGLIESIDEPRQIGIARTAGGIQQCLLEIIR